jgi:hypothetical protein
MINFERGKNIKATLDIGLVGPWLRKRGITIANYDFKDGDPIDIEGDVDLSNQELVEIPPFIRFHKVSGNFWIDGNNLTTLESCPKEVGGSFSCTNNKLTSLDHQPEIIKGNFWF